MTNNICGNKASPLRGEVGCVADSPTLRVGLIFIAPSELGILLRLLLLSFALCAVCFTACSPRISYEAVSVVNAAPNTININTAKADELEKLPYIGKKTAEAIVQFRKENGPYRRVEHIMQIRGISEKRFMELRQFLKTE